MFSSVRERFISFADDQRRERLDRCMEIQLALDECLRVAARKERNEKKQQKESSSKNNSKSSIWNKFSRKNEEINNQNTSVPHSQKQQQEDDSDEPKIKLEDTLDGIKISRFYGWGLENPRAEAAIAEMREKSDTWLSMKSISDEKKNNAATATATHTINDAKMNDSTTFSTSSKIDDINDSNSINSSDKSNTINDAHSVHCTRETHALYACKALALGCGSELMTMKKCFANELGTTNPSSTNYDGSQQNHASSSRKCQLEQRNVGDCIRKNMDEMNQRLVNKSS